MIVVLRVTASVIQSYSSYLPPNFDTDFLRGRQAYFFGVYQFAFYMHIAAGPSTLLFGLLLTNKTLRDRYRTLHRVLGRIQCGCILLLLLPSGLWMAFYAETGAVAGTGFGTLAVVTAICTIMGLRSAVNKKMVQHRTWMCRCFVLLCSAVVQRMMGGLGTVLEIQSPWAYPVISWASWLGPLLVFEFINRAEKSHKELSV